MDREEAYNIIKKFIDSELICEYDDPVWNPETYKAIHVLLDEYKQMMEELRHENN